jgi:hypothetical protein
MMKNQSEKETQDGEKIKKFLIGLGFICNSYPSAQNIIYSKNKDVVIVKNNEKNDKPCIKEKIK